MSARKLIVAAVLASFAVGSFAAPRHHKHHRHHHHHHHVVHHR